MQSLSRCLAGGLAAVCLLAAAAAHAAYPTRPITFIVPWGAGGGTDAVSRMLATLMERDLGKPINVVNRTGGNGVVGHAAIAGARPDGYTIGMVTLEIGMMHHQGLTTLSGASAKAIAAPRCHHAASITLAKEWARGRKRRIESSERKMPTRETASAS